MEIINNPNVSGLLICGLVFIATGFFIKKKPPKNINSLYGYRTPASMKSQERWDFAQIYGAVQMVKAGVLLCILGLVAAMFLYYFSVSMPVSLIIFSAVLLLVSLLLILKVEAALKKKFK